MNLMLERAWLDDVPIHDVANLQLRFALRSASRRVPRRSARSPRPRAHGGVNRTRWLEAQLWDLAGYCDAGSVAATQVAMDELGRLLLPDRDHVFRFRRYGFPEDEQIGFRETSELDAPAKGWQPQVRWSVSLIGDDPRVYGAALKVASYDPTTAASGSGLSFPLEFPLVFEGPVTTTLAVENQGTIETPPVLTVRGPVTNPIVDNETTGESIHLTELELVANDLLELDVARRRARRAVVGGAYTVHQELIDARLTRWFELPRGVSQLRLRGQGFVTGQTQLAVSFRDARG